MSPPVGPKATDPGLGKLLQLRQQLEAPDKTEKLTEKATEKSTEKVVLPSLASDVSSLFEGSVGTSQTLATPIEGAGGSQVLARLKARGFEGRRLAKTAEKPLFVDTAEGRVLSGSLTIESRAGLQKLEGVVRVGGDLTIREGVLKNADLLSLKSLKTVERRLTFEGLSAP